VEWFKMANLMILHIPTSMCRYTSGSAAFANSLKTKPVTNLKWRRVVFKISGSALAGNCQNIDPKVQDSVFG